MGKRIALSWDTIAAFILSGISKYIYALPGIFIVAISTLADFMPLINTVRSANSLRTYLSFSIIYSLNGVLFHAFCPTEVKKYLSCDLYVEKCNIVYSNEKIGSLRSELMEKPSTERASILEKYYTKKNESMLWLRLFITITLALGMIAPFATLAERFVLAWGWQPHQAGL